MLALAHKAFSICVHARPPYTASGQGLHPRSSWGVIYIAFIISADTHLPIRFQNRHDGCGSMNKHFSFLSLSPALESFSKTLLTFSWWSSLFLPLRYRQLTLLHVRFLVRDSSWYVERSQVQTRLQTTGDFIDRVPCVCLMSHTL